MVYTSFPSTTFKGSASNLENKYDTLVWEFDTGIEGNSKIMRGLMDKSLRISLRVRNVHSLTWRQWGCVLHLEKCFQVFAPCLPSNASIRPHCEHIAARLWGP